MSCTEPLHVFLVVNIYVLKQIPINFSCFGECCNAVLLSRSRNVLRTTKLYKTFHHGVRGDNDWIFLFGGSNTLTQCCLSWDLWTLAKYWIKAVLSCKNVCNPISQVQSRFRANHLSDLDAEFSKILLNRLVAVVVHFQPIIGLIFSMFPIIALRL